MNGSESFSERCYVLLRQIPEGRVSSYREIAHALGSRAYRAVGNVMNHNPYPTDLYPCHRVVKSDGTVGGYVWGTEVKTKRLREEGLSIVEGKVVNFESLLMQASEFDLSGLN